MDPGRPGWLFLELWSTARHSVRLVAELLAEEGVGDDELACLLQLSASPDGLTITDVASAMSVPFMSASDAVGRLERAGDVRRAQHPSDRRSSLIRLTTSGARRADAAAELLDRLARSLTRSAGTTPATTRTELARLANVFAPER
jgi:DNA-binding MarR family transcriptional regulator